MLAGNRASRRVIRFRRLLGRPSCPRPWHRRRARCGGRAPDRGSARRVAGQLRHSFHVRQRGPLSRIGRIAMGRGFVGMYITLGQTHRRHTSLGVRSDEDPNGETSRVVCSIKHHKSVACARVGGWHARCAVSLVIARRAPRHGAAQGAHAQATWQVARLGAAGQFARPPPGLHGASTARHEASRAVGVHASARPLQ